jgi:hypothetical protein
LPPKDVNPYITPAGELKPEQPPQWWWTHAPLAGVSVGAGERVRGSVGNALRLAGQNPTLVAEAALYSTLVFASWGLAAAGGLLALLSLLQSRGRRWVRYAALAVNALVSLGWCGLATWSL